MLYEFNVVSTATNCALPQQAYFDALLMSAVRALASSEIELNQAWAFCEYLDAVDSRAMQSSPRVYQRCLTALLHFMESGGDKDVRELVAKSWAAKTCEELLVEAEQRNKVVRIRMN